MLEQSNDWIPRIVKSFTKKDNSNVTCAPLIVFFSGSCCSPSVFIYATDSDGYLTSPPCHIYFADKEDIQIINTTVARETDTIPMQQVWQYFRKVTLAYKEYCIPIMTKIIVIYITCTISIFVSVEQQFKSSFQIPCRLQSNSKKIKEPLNPDILQTSWLTSMSPG